VPGAQGTQAVPFDVSPFAHGTHFLFLIVSLFAQSPTHASIKVGPDAAATADVESISRAVFREEAPRPTWMDAENDNL
jgi:hypothetical protein